MIECDGRTLYMGSLGIATDEVQQRYSVELLCCLIKGREGQSIVFSNDPKLVRMEKNKVCVHSASCIVL